MTVSRPQDHAAEFDRLYRQAKRDGRAMNHWLRAATIFLALCCFGFCICFMLIMVGAPEAGVKIWSGLCAFFCGITSGQLFWIGSTVPSPPKEPA